MKESTKREKEKTTQDLVATFSIVGYDPATEELGIAVQSKFLAVGAVVPWAKAGVGAIATQSMANTTYGPEGLELLASGKTAQETLDLLTNQDEGRMMRQAGIVDAKGRAATYTGNQCYDWAGGMTGTHYAAQGNILVDKKTVDAMGETFEQTEGPLAERLLAALNAGQAAGGDSRGKQSAALLVVKDKGGYGGYNDRAVDVRVDDHPEPIDELIRIYHLHQLYFTRPKEDQIVAVEGDVRLQLVSTLYGLNYLPSEQHVDDASLYKALSTYIHTENFEEREQDPGFIDKNLLEFMKRQK